MLQVLVDISQKFCCRKEAWGYAKVCKKEGKEKNGHKSGPEVKKKKEKRKRDENKDNPCSRKNIPQERNIFQRA